MTFHVALLLGSEDTYADRPATILHQEGELNGWNFRLSARSAGSPDRRRPGMIFYAPDPADPYLRHEICR